MEIESEEEYDASEALANMLVKFKIRLAEELKTDIYNDFGYTNWEICGSCLNRCNSCACNNDYDDYHYREDSYDDNEDDKKVFDAVHDSKSADACKDGVYPVQIKSD